MDNEPEFNPYGMGMQVPCGMDTQVPEESNCMES